MSRHVAPKKRRIPVAAVLAFVACAALAARSLLGTLNPMTPLPTDPTDSQDPQPEESPGEGAATIAWRDLLAVHGSFAAGADVRSSFGMIVDATNGAAPAGEAAAWVGDDPPRLRLGVVMVSGTARRAVFGGRLVGVGDVVGDAIVTGIDVGVVTTDWRGRVLHYELGGDAPREFRGELARRAARAEPTEGQVVGEKRRAGGSAPAGEGR